MNKLTKVFEQNDLTIIEVEGNFHFLLKDVCEILGLSNPRHVKTRLDEDVVSNYPLQTAGGLQQATFVNEDGLYDVILDSRKPEAKRFRKWITSEVLPSIRKTGSFVDTSQLSPELQMFNQIFNAVANTQLQMKEQDVRIGQIESEQKRVTEVIALKPGNDWREKTNTILSRIAESLGGGKQYNVVRGESYKLLESRAKCRLNIRLENMKREAYMNGVASKTKINSFNKLDVINNDGRLLEIYVAIVKEMAVTYKVDIKGV